MLRRLTKRITAIAAMTTFAFSSIYVYAEEQDNVVIEVVEEISNESGASGESSSEEITYEVTVTLLSEESAPVSQESHVEAQSPIKAEAPVEAQSPVKAEAPVEATTSEKAEAPVEATAPEKAEAAVEAHTPEKAEVPVETTAPEKAEAAVEALTPEMQETVVEATPSKPAIPATEEEHGEESPAAEEAPISAITGSKAPVSDADDGGLFNEEQDNYYYYDDVYTYEKSIESFSTSQSVTGRYNANFIISEHNTITGVTKRYQYTISGFASETDAKTYVDKMCSAEYDSSSREYCIIDNNLIDAEKQPSIYNSEDPEADINGAYDAYLCWAGSVSDMLTLSGWNTIASNKSEAIDLSNEDSVFDYYAQSFTDFAGNQKYGIIWLFNGIYSAQNYSDWAQLKKEMGTEGNGGFIKEYCTEDVIYSVGEFDQDSLAGLLKSIDADEDGDRCSIGLIFGYYYEDENGEEKRPGGHCVTIVGYSTDENGVPNTITIADSDNYNGDNEYTYSSSNNRSDYANSYSTYPIEYFDGKWHIMNLLKRYDTVIDELDVLKYYSDNIPKEDGGTLDLFNYFDMYGYGNHLYKYDYFEEVRSVYEGDTLNAGFIVNDNSVCQVFGGDHITYRFEISRDGSVIRNCDYSFDVSAIENGGMGSLLSGIIMDGETSLAPGEYSVSFIVNYDRSVTEAYYNNNRMKNSIKFVVLKRVDENGNVHYDVVPKEEYSDNNEEDTTVVSEFISVVVENPVVNDISAFEKDPKKTFEVAFSGGVSGIAVSDADILRATITSDVPVTRNDYVLLRNTDGSLKVVFGNEFMKKLPKGIHYFRMIIAGKTYVFKIEIK